jgi:hypothetical protein
MYKTNHTIPSTCTDVPTKFQINRTWYGRENSSLLKLRFSRFLRVFLFCLFIIWKTIESWNQNMHTNLGYQPKVSTKFSSTGLCIVEKLQCPSVPTPTNNRHESQTIVRCSGQKNFFFSVVFFLYFFYFFSFSSLQIIHRIKKIRSFFEYTR